MYKLLEECSYDYRRLLSMFPESTPFYYIYEEGDYYNKACTKYYDRDKIEIDIEQHNYYG